MTVTVSAPPQAQLPSVSPTAVAKEPSSPSQGMALEERARVLWVGNVPRGLRDIDLKVKFTMAMAQHDRVTHVRIKRQPRRMWDSATVFLNRCVHVPSLISRMRAVHPFGHCGRHFLIRKCRGKDKKAKKAEQQTKDTAQKAETSSTSSGSPSPPSSVSSESSEQAVQAAAAAARFFAKQIRPLPAGLHVDSCIYDAFVRSLDDFDVFVGLDIPQ